jgi:hypothetical protein
MKPQRYSERHCIISVPRTFLVHTEYEFDLASAWFRRKYPFGSQRAARKFLVAAGSPQSSFLAAHPRNRLLWVDPVAATSVVVTGGSQLRSLTATIVADLAVTEAIG